MKTDENKLHDAAIIVNTLVWNLKEYGFRESRSNLLFLNRMFIESELITEIEKNKREEISQLFEILFDCFEDIQEWKNKHDSLPTDEEIFERLQTIRNKGN